MLTFNNIVLHNFGSYNHTELDLKDKGFCIVSGRNYCKKDNAFSNGSGKTFLFHGICFAITGETVNGLHNNLKNINIDENLAYVTLDFNVDSDHYIITRYIEPKSDLKIIRNDVDVSGKGIRESEKKLSEYLPDLTKDLLASTIILGQGLPNKFTAFSPVGRKELLEKLTKSDFMIEDMKTRIAKRIEELNRKLREYEDSLLVNNTQLTNINALITKTESELASTAKPENDSKVKELTELISDINNRLAVINLSITEIEADVEKENAKLLKYNEDKSTTLAAEAEGYNNRFRDESIAKVKLESEINSLTLEINKLKNITDICPTCGQKIPGVQKPSTIKLEESLSELNVKLVNQNKTIAEINQKHINNQQIINNSFSGDIKSSSDYLAALKINLNKLKETKNSLTNELSVNSGLLEKINYDLLNYDKTINKLKAELLESTKQKQKYESIIKLTEEGKNDTVEHLSIVRKLDSLSKREYRGYILTNIINHLNIKTKEYSRLVFGTDEFEIYLDGNALDISYCGKLVESLSGGERTRVDLILQFAIRDLLSSQLNITSNILVLDEVTDFLDATSCAAVMQLIENELNMVESVFIISHHAESLNLSFDSEIKVVKNSEGISEVY